MSVTAMAAVVPRRRVTVSGTVTCVHTPQRPSVRTDVHISDGTGVVVLRFLGRTSVAGMAAGCRIVADGTPGVDGEALVILNPLYSFVGAG